MLQTKPAGVIVKNMIILLLLFLFLIPLFYTLSTSLKFDSEIYKTPVSLIPQILTPDHFIHIFTKLRRDFFSFFKNSVIVTVVSVSLILSLSSLASYALARMKFIGRRLVIFFVSLVVSIPLIITVIPVFMMETFLKIKNTNLGLILPYTAVFMPIPLFILYATFLKIPTELEESARIDGCSRFNIYYKIFLPLSRGGLVSAGIISFLNCWGEFLYALILTSNRSSTTLPIGILMIKNEEQAWELGPLSSIIILSIIIPVTLYMGFQKNFIRGLMEGSLKG